MRFLGDKSKAKDMTTFPAGEYYLTCVDATKYNKNDEELKTKDGDPMYLLEMAVSEGPYKNRRIWHYFCFFPPSHDAHGMTLRALHAFGFPNEGEIDIEPEMFVGLSVKARIEIEQNDLRYDPKNVIKKWLIVGDQAQPPTAQPAPNGGEKQPDWVDEGTIEGAQRRRAEQAAAPATGRRLPWKK